MIHEAYYKNEIALRYYRAVSPDRNYDKEAARKQFGQDRKIDKKALIKVIDEVREEQVEMIVKSK